MLKYNSDASPIWQPCEVPDSAYARMGLPFDRKDLVPVDKVKLEGDGKKALLNYSQRAPALIAKGIGVYLYGSGGVGKSYGLACLAYTLRKQGAHVLRVSAQRAFEAVGFEDNYRFSDDQTLAERMRSVHVLFIDSLGTEYLSNKSSFALDKFYDLLVFRRQQPFAVTWFTSALSPTGGRSEFRQRYGDPIADIMPEICVPVLVQGTNHRAALSKQMRQELLG